MAHLELQYQYNLIEAGCDEAGRGCLAGPVVAAAVILPAGFSETVAVDDSKKLSEKERFRLRDIIMAEAVCYAIGICSHTEIDQINILNASILAMHRALAQLAVQPEYISVDGNRFKQYNDIPHKTIVKGDGKYLNIAAASILAKTERDILMTRLSADYPVYLWAKNKGYPTADHRQAIAAHGITPHHRRSFNLLDTQLKIEWPDEV